MLSIIVCTHNPRVDYLRRCLAAIKAQTLPIENWELLIIDNASAPEKAPEADLSWHPKARSIFEGRLGLTAARLRGIRETKGEILVFVDDDNVLDPDFLQVVVSVAEKKRFLGSWSGQCRPEFETPPPEWTRRYWGNLVIREFDSDIWSNLPRLAESMPCGAGLCVRREAAQHYVWLHESGRRTFQFDRTGESLVSGGDNDLAACACDIGLGAGLIAGLKLVHLIPSVRLTEEYLARLMEGIYFSSVLLDAERGIKQQPRAFVGRVADTLKVMRQRKIHRQMIKAAYRGRDRALEMLWGQSEISKRLT
jgi:glycosyltransferase involved in cell wall biosynthesis